MIYLTSDTHFCHNKDFLYEPRGFQSIGDDCRAGRSCHEVSEQS